MAKKKWFFPNFVAHSWSGGWLGSNEVSPRNRTAGRSESRLCYVHEKKESKPRKARKTRKGNHCELGATGSASAQSAHGGQFGRMGVKYLRIEHFSAHQTHWLVRTKGSCFTALLNNVCAVIIFSSVVRLTACTGRSLNRADRVVGVFHIGLPQLIRNVRPTTSHTRIKMDYATRFVAHLKSYFDHVPFNVWYDFERNLHPDRTWDEDSILRTSILRNGLDQTSLLRNANDNPVYELQVKSFDYGGKGDETITGADLAVVFRLELNKSLVARRLCLVQLKRAFFEDGRTVFPALHHKSGKQYYGDDFHQAQKMLFFSTTPVYWIATTSALMEDAASLKAYSDASNLSATSTVRTPVSESDASYGFGFDPLHSTLHSSVIQSASSLSPGDIEEYLEYLYHYPPFHRIWRHIGKTPSGHVLKSNLQHVQANLPYHSWQLLRSRLRQYSSENYGMPQRIGLFVCNAEDVYLLSHDNRRSFTDLYTKSIPFTEFMMRNVLCDDFGDSNEELINAILERDVKGYFHDRVQKIAERFDYRVPDDLAELMPVNHAIVTTVQVTTVPQDVDRQG